MATGLATDRISLLSWRNISFAANHQWTFRSIIDIAIDLVTTVDIFCESQGCVCLQPRRQLGMHMHGVSLTRHRSHNLLPKSDHRHSTAQCSDCSWSHYICNNCIYIRSHLLRWYKLNCNRFNHRERPIFFSASATSNNPPFFLVVIRWLRNDFSIPRAPENMSHENIHNNVFLHLDVI